MMRPFGGRADLQARVTGPWKGFSPGGIARSIYEMVMSVADCWEEGEELVTDRALSAVQGVG
jgi:hypothetical protein